MAAGVTYEPLATTTLTATSTTITFSSISGSYTDLRLVLVWKTTSANASAIQFNSDTAFNYSATYLDGTGTAAESNRQTGLSYIDASWNAVGSSQPAFTTFDIFSYAGSTFKTVLCTTAGDSNGSGGIDASIGLWRSTSAITEIKLRFAGSTLSYAIGTTATLYGILKA